MEGFVQKGLYLQSSWGKLHLLLDRPALQKCLSHMSVIGQLDSAHMPM